VASVVKVLQVNAHGADSSVGGTEKHLETLGRELGARGFEVSLLSAFPGRIPPTFARSATLHAAHWRDDRLRRVRNHAGDVVAQPTRRLREAVEAFEPDLVHTHNLPGITTAVWEVSRRLGVPVVHTLHDYHLLCPRVTLLRRDGERCRPHPLLCGLRAQRLGRWARGVSHVISVSRHLLAEHGDLFRHATAHIVRNPLPRARNGAGAPPRPRLGTIGYLGALETIKGVDRLLAAAAELEQLGCDLRLAGDGRLRPDVEQAAARSPRLAYDGVVSGAAKENFLRRCDVGIVPSVWAEPGGPTNVMVEWLAAGRPALVSNRGGLAEAIPLFPGAIAVEPTTTGIAAAVKSLVDEQAWRRAVESVRPPSDGDDDVARWVSDHERIFRAALGSCAAVAVGASA
jgi:glycosyltransferase involved in cell wall biosynthesis